MNKETEILPHPGQMEKFVEAKTEVFGKLAAKGQLYDATVAEFVSRTEEHLQKILAGQQFTAQQKEDAKAAKFLLLGRLEWIERNKEKYKKWQANTLSFYETQNESLDRMAMEYRKYIFIAFGASFLFAFNSLISPSTPTDYIAPLTTAIYIMIGGLISTVFIFWFEGTARAKERDFAQESAFAWDPETIHRHWTSHFRPLINPAIIVALLTIPIAGIIFVHQIDIFHSVPIPDSFSVTDTPP